MARLRSPLAGRRSTMSSRQGSRLSHTCVYIYCKCNSSFMPKFGSIIGTADGARRL